MKNGQQDRKEGMAVTLNKVPVCEISRSHCLRRIQNCPENNAEFGEQRANSKRSVCGMVNIKGYNLRQTG
jgi:hypothetical protein